MEDQDGHHSEIMTKFLTQVTSLSRDVDLTITFCTVAFFESKRKEKAWHENVFMVRRPNVKLKYWFYDILGIPDFWPQIFSHFRMLDFSEKDEFAGSTSHFPSKFF